MNLLLVIGALVSTGFAGITLVGAKVMDNSGEQTSELVKFYCWSIIIVNTAGLVSEYLA